MASVTSPPSEETFTPPQQSTADTLGTNESGSRTKTMDVNDLYDPRDVDEAVRARMPINAMTWMFALLIGVFLYVVYFAISHIRLKRNVEKQQKQVREVVPGAIDEDSKEYMRKYNEFMSSEDSDVHISELKKPAARQN